jgi:hypothetical protein
VLGFTPTLGQVRVATQNPGFDQILYHLFSHHRAFNIGEIIDVSLLNSLVLNWDGILDKELSLKT